MAKYRGTIRKLGLSGGLWALVGDDGRQLHLVDPPASLLVDGMRVVAEGTEPKGASIAMIGGLLSVTSFEKG
jgi:hypothetical protein